MRFAIFPLHLSKVLHLPRKSDAGSYEVLHLSRKIIFANLKIWCSKMQPLLGNQRPDLLTSLLKMSLMRMSLVLRCHTKFICPDPLQMSHACHCFWNCYKALTFLLTFDKMQNPLPLPRKTTSEPSKVVLLTFWLGNVLRAATACTLSTSQLPKVVRSWCALCILIWTCASRHNGVQFLISHLAPIIWKTQWIATFLPFRGPASSFFWLFLFSDLLSSSFLFSDSSYLCFSICPYCRKFDF